MPGAMVITRMPLLASSRAMGRVRATTPPGRGVGYLPDLAVESGHAGRVDDDAALSALRWITADHGLGGEPDDVEGADEVDLHDLREGIERVRSFSSEDLLRAGDPGAV